KEKRKVTKVLHKQQRQGRLIGLTLDDLGEGETWLASSLTGTGGQPAPGPAGLQAQRYVLDLTLADKDLTANARARLQLKAGTGLTRVVRLELSSELKVSQVTDAGGAKLPFRQVGGEVMVVLPEAPAIDSELALEVLYEGKLLEKVEG